MNGMDILWDLLLDAHRKEVDKLNKEIELLYDMANITFSDDFIDSELKRVGAK